MPMIGYGIIYRAAAWGFPLAAVGALVIIGSFIGWGVEPLEEPHEDHGAAHGDESEPGNDHGEDA